jgi:hypothetical protein
MWESLNGGEDPTDDDRTENDRTENDRGEDASAGTTRPAS